MLSLREGFIISLDKSIKGGGGSAESRVFVNISGLVQNFSDKNIMNPSLIHSMMKGSKSDLNLLMTYFVLSFNMVARSGKDQTQTVFLMYPWQGSVPQFCRWPLSFKTKLQNQSVTHI